ncbi:hypothetical protein AB0N33_00685 [Pseudarthrobacter oxydans]|uniref:hypothetical protein n=1 Tax=Pseudarthrobacter oxydans TaxID=1671 RepID=UPI00343A7DD8
MQTSPATPTEVIESLDVGDHRNLSRLSVRALLGFALMGFRFVTRRTYSVRPMGAPEIVHVIANPVAHGAALSSAVSDSLSGMKVARIADARLADPTIGVDFDAAGLSPRSMSAILSRGHLARAIRLRTSTPRSAVRSLSTSWLYSEYLFVAQAVRYFVAEDVLATIPDSTTVLTDFDRHAYARPWVVAAKRRGLPTVTMMHGSPNARYYVPVLADTALVWGQAQVEWLSRHSPDTVARTIGRPELEAGITDTTPLKRAIVCHSAEDLTSGEANRMASAISMIQARGIRVSLRLHPSATSGAGATWSPVQNIADETIMSRGSFVASLAPGDGVVVVTSTSAVEALTTGYRVLVLADAERDLPSDLEAMRSLPSNTVETFLNDHEIEHSFREGIVAHTGEEARRKLKSVLAQQGVSLRRVE